MATAVSSWKVYNGNLTKYEHASTSTNTKMVFSVYVPASAANAPVLYWLSGLTCTDDNFSQKAVSAFEVAAEKGIVMVMPDTSPRGAGCVDDKLSWDFGEGAGFYVDATEDNYKKHYNMFSYVNEELPAVLSALLKDTISTKRSIMGHSMGGHGSLVSYFKSASTSNPFQSVSAFAPICHPSACPWGLKAFSGYLGADKSAWEKYDATALVAKFNGNKSVPVLIEQGGADKFLHENQLLPQDFIEAAKKNNVQVIYNLREGYDHSYFFITSFIKDHVNFHAKYLF